jgi:hypothetical protein
MMSPLQTKGFAEVLRGLLYGEAGARSTVAVADLEATSCPVQSS